MKKLNRTTAPFILAILATGVFAADSLTLYDRDHVPSPNDVAKMLLSQKSSLQGGAGAKTRGISLDPQGTGGAQNALAQQNDRLGAFALQINFPLNSAEVDANFIPHLAAIAKGIQIAGTEAKIVVEGHTDVSGSQAHNEDLSLRRAEAVRSLLVEKYAVRADRLAAAGYGPRQLADVTDPYSGKNRRVQFRVAE